jgi:hypothetical protein
LGLRAAGSRRWQGGSPLTGGRDAAREPDREGYVDRDGAKLNRHDWLRHYPGLVEFFSSEMSPEPHSSKHIEDDVGWAVETSAEVMLAAADASFGCP